jgi:hypothetical protein
VALDPFVTPTRPAKRRDVIAAAANTTTRHQFRFKAGVPGCSCGATFPDTAGIMPTALHAAHLAPLILRNALGMAAATLLGELPAEAAEAAVSALAGMVREEKAAPQRKALEQ